MMLINGELLSHCGQQARDCGLVASYIFMQAQTLEEEEGVQGEVHLFPDDYVFIQNTADKFFFPLISFLLF